MSELVIEGLRASVGDREILRGVDLVVRSGEVHAIMGPNGSGKSTLSGVIMGRPGYTVTGGSVRLDGTELLGLDVWQRAQAGVFLAMQYPVEVPGVSLGEVLTAAANAGGRDSGSVAELVASRGRSRRARPFVSAAIAERRFLRRGEEAERDGPAGGASGRGFAILDEIDSGLDVDALGQVARRVEDATTEWSLGVIAVTHYNRLLEQLHADVVHIFAGGKILQSGGPELATQLEISGYGEWAPAEPSAAPLEPDPFDL
jgi:Fe-S cluster assembly ATP-binding protein